MGEKKKWERERTERGIEGEMKPKSHNTTVICLNFFFLQKLELLDLRFRTGERGLDVRKSFSVFVDHHDNPPRPYPPASALPDPGGRLKPCQVSRGIGGAGIAITFRPGFCVFTGTCCSPLHTEAVNRPDADRCARKSASPGEMTEFLSGRRDPRHKSADLSFLGGFLCFLTHVF